MVTRKILFALIGVFAYYIQIECSTVDSNILVTTIRPNITVGNAGLKCYQCNGTSCENPLDTSTAKVQKCSEEGFESTGIKEGDYANYDLSHIVYNCIKTIEGNNNTTRGCVINRVDNKEVCEVYRETIKSLNRIAQALENWTKGKTDAAIDSEEGIDFTVPLVTLTYVIHLRSKSKASLNK
ncbi:hypothetical protein NQ317_019329, partial [Molorchus minor]